MAAVPRSDSATPGTASVRMGLAACRMLLASADSAPWKIEHRQKDHQHDVRVHRRLGQHVHQHEQQPDDDERDVVGNVEAFRADGDGRADRQDEEQLLERREHDSDAASQPAACGNVTAELFQVPARRSLGERRLHLFQGLPGDQDVRPVDTVLVGAGLGQRPDRRACALGQGVRHLPVATGTLAHGVEGQRQAADQHALVIGCRREQLRRLGETADTIRGNAA